MTSINIWTSVPTLPPRQIGTTNSLDEKQDTTTKQCINVVNRKVTLGRSLVVIDYVITRAKRVSGHNREKIKNSIFL